MSGAQRMEENYLVWMQGRRLGTRAVSNGVDIGTYIRELFFGFLS